MSILHVEAGDILASKSRRRRLGRVNKSDAEQQRTDQDAPGASRWELPSIHPTPLAPRTFRSQPPAPRRRRLRAGRATGAPRCWAT
ncbi:MAG: hypothetical protein KY475_21165 [Planctomycetes bacterium]|nr:hypothetical protein [Planctomycetota bacterium]